MDEIAAVVLSATLAAVIARQLLLRGPPTWLLFVVGAVAMVATGALSPSGAVAAIWTDAPVPLFLLALFILAAGVDEAGVLDALARWIVRRARTPADVPVLVFLAFGALSAFVVNDAVVLVGVPVVLALARRLGRSPRPLLLSLMLSVTVGSVPTPFGNPQNLLVSLDSGLTSPVVTFARYLAIPTILALLAGSLLLRRPFAREYGPASDGAPLSVDLAPVPPPEPWGVARMRTLVAQHPSVAVFPLTLAAIVASDLWAGEGGGPAVPLYLVALGGAGLALALSRRRRALLKRVDLPILVLFVALFVVVAGATAGGVVAQIGSLLAIPGPGRPLLGLAAILLSALAGAQLVSNVPWVALQIPVLQGLGYSGATPTAWLALSAGSTLGGGVTLLGAASNLIVVEQAEREGIRIGLQEFIRVGLPVVALSVGILFVALAVGI